MLVAEPGLPREDRPTVRNDPILVVDDDHDIREAIVETLKMAGYITAEASNGKEALHYLTGSPKTRLIILDLMMPVMNGYEFRRLQLADERLKGIPVVIASAYIKAGSHDLSADAILGKPFNDDTLLQAVEECALPPTR